MLKLKKTTWLLLIAAAVIIVLLVVLVINRNTFAPPVEMQVLYEDNPAHWFKDMKLIWNDTAYYETHIDHAKRGREIGYATDEYSTWHIYELKGYNRDYLYAVESEDVWRIFSSIPPEKPFRQYILENATDKQRFERLLSVTLNNDGTAQLATPGISSYAIIGPCYYVFEDGELLIYQQRNNIMARFTVIDDNTVIFKDASVPLYADNNALYVSAGTAAE